MIFDAKGNLYGTTAQGGETGNGYANGTVFKVSKSGKETVLYRFGGGAAAGANPYAGLIMDAKGNLYGTTANAGDGFGDVFELSNVGKVTVLYSFPGDGREGETPKQVWLWTRREISMAPPTKEAHTSMPAWCSS